MKPPSEFEVNQLLHAIQTAYDPAKAHAYYLRTRELRGRQPGQGEERNTRGTQNRFSRGARSEQRQKLTQQIQNLENKLKKLEDLILKRENEEASENRKFKARKERARKEADKPKMVVEKSVIVHENKKSRSSSNSGQSVSDLKALATKVKGQIVVARQKLAAL